MTILTDRTVDLDAPAAQPVAAESEYWRRAVECDATPLPRLLEQPPGFGMQGDIRLADHQPTLCASCWGETVDGECLHPGCRDSYLAEVAPQHAVRWTS